jgi:5-methylcytosine-specific restriction endonuclease McrA
MGYKDLDKQRKYQRERVARIRAEYLDGKCCVNCGSKGPLEVDHIDPSTKESHAV